MESSIVDTQRNDLQMYTDFFSLFIGFVIGKKRFEGLCFRENLSTFVTISDKALALLIFENNYDRWIDMGKNNNWASSSVRPKYTTGGNANQTPKSSKKKNKASTKKSVEENNDNKGSTCAKYQGWSIEGLRKYNKLFDAIRAERESPLGNEFEDALLAYSQNYKASCSKKPRQEAIEYETCRHELWSVAITPQTETIVEEVVESVLENYTLFGSNDD